MRVLMVPDWRGDNPYQQLLADALIAEGVDVVFPEGYRRVLPLWRSLRTMQPRIQVLHLHWHEGYIRSVSPFGQCFYGLKLLLDLLLVKASGCRVVWTIHNEVPHDAKWPAFFRALQRILPRLADAVIVHSRTALDTLRPQLGHCETKASVIPHAYYRDFYGPLVPKQEARRALSLPVQTRLLMYFGLIGPYKGVEDLLEAWRQVSVDGEPAQLLIVGSAKSEVYGERIATQAKDLSNVILRLKFIPVESVHLYFSAADCVVLPFRKILTSGSLTLARSYSVPVVVPDFPSVREEVTLEDGRFFSPNDPSALCSSLRAEIASPQGERMGNSVTPCREWRSVAQKTAAIYDAVSLARN